MDTEDPQTLDEEQFRSFFAEKDELFALLEPFETKNFDRIIEILQKYQEQPQLLDPHLSYITNLLVLKVRNFLEATHGEQEEPEEITYTFKILYMLTKVRGYKTIIKLFPHEVVDLLRTFNFLTLKMGIETSEWESIYILFLWLNIIVLIPFGLDALDSSDTTVPLRKLLFETGKKGLADPRIINRSASEFIGTLITRPDFKHELSEYLTWAKDKITTPIETSSDAYFIKEIIYSLCKVMVLGERSTMMQFAKDFIQNTLHESIPYQTNKKLSTKLFVCFGLVLLPPRTPKWKYSKKKQSLERNLGQLEETTTLEEILEDEEEYDIPEDIEFIIGMLLEHLKDKQTSVRWSASKGLARIANRLPFDLVEDIIQSLYDNFSPLETDSTFHGTCLAIAELIRRGLILPYRIEDLTKNIITALRFEQRRGNLLTGSHVRDAACYVCWSLARTYEASVFTPTIRKELCNALLVSALFDREINCRRAAAAAIQEYVGRQAFFPHGIEIIGKANFFSLANRTNSYTHISVDIASSFPEYKLPLLKVLCENKYIHSDQSIREITAQALYHFVPLAPDHFIATVIPEFIKKTRDRDVHVHHGALLSLSHILKSFYQLQISLPEDLNEELVDIPILIDKLGYHKGKFGHLIRITTTQLIESISLLKISLSRPVKSLPDSKKGYQSLYMHMLEDNLKSSVEEISQQASITFYHFLSTHFDNPTPSTIEKLSLRWVKSIDNETVYAKRGYYLGLGSLTKSLIGPHCTTIVDKLIEGMSITLNNVETRKNSLLAITNLVKNNSLFGDGISESHTNNILKAMVFALDDYTTDNRGDIGSIVRETSLESFITFIECLGESRFAWIEESILENYVNKIFKQLFEKIDRTRQVAGDSLTRFSALHPYIQTHHPELYQRIQSTSIIWGSSQDVFPQFITILNLSNFRKSILQGIIRSVGGKSNNKELVEVSVSSLSQYLFQVSQKDIEAIATTMIEIMTPSNSTDYDIVAISKTIESMLSTGKFSDLQPCTSTFTTDILRIVQKEMTKPTLSKLFAFSSLLPLLVSYENPTRSESLKILLKFMGSKYPALKKATAETLYVQLETNEAFTTQEWEDVKEILISNTWDETGKGAYPELLAAIKRVL